MISSLEARYIINRELLNMKYPYYIRKVDNYISFSELEKKKDGFILNR